MVRTPHLHRPGHGFHPGWGTRSHMLMSEHLPHSSFPVLSGGPPPFPGASLVAQMVKNPPAMQGDLGLIPGLRRSPGEGNGYPLYYSGLENFFMDSIVHGVAKSQTRLSGFHVHSIAV